MGRLSDFNVKLAHAYINLHVINSKGTVVHISDYIVVSFKDHVNACSSTKSEHTFHAVIKLML